MEVKAVGDLLDATFHHLHPHNNNNDNLMDLNLNRLSLSPANSIDSEPGDPLTKRLNHFRQIGVGCDVAFVVGEEKEVSPVPRPL